MEKTMTVYPKPLELHIKKGALSRQLGVPEPKNIPIGFLRAIVATPIGETAKNPAKLGKSQVTVTKLLKRRAVLALNMKTKWR
jgi:hypothetical protein